MAGNHYHSPTHPGPTQLSHFIWYSVVRFNFSFLLSLLTHDEGVCNRMWAFSSYCFLLWSWSSLIPHLLEYWVASQPLPLFWFLHLHSAYPSFFLQCFWFCHVCLKNTTPLPQISVGFLLANKESHLEFWGFLHCPHLSFPALSCTLPPTCPKFQADSLAIIFTCVFHHLFFCCNLSIFWMFSVLPVESSSSIQDPIQMPFLSMEPS